jgi:hypothetical protein
MVTDTNFAGILGEKCRVGGAKLVSVTIFRTIGKIP